MQIHYLVYICSIKLDVEIKMAKKSNNPLVAEINKNFLIKWRNHGETKFNLISAGQYHKIVGEEFKNRHFAEVLKGGLDKYIFKIRKRLEIHFLSK